MRTLRFKKLSYFEQTEQMAGIKVALVYRVIDKQFFHVHPTSPGFPVHIGIGERVRRNVFRVRVCLFSRVSSNKIARSLTRRSFLVHIGPPVTSESLHTGRLFSSTLASVLVRPREMLRWRSLKWTKKDVSGVFCGYQRKWST